MHHAWRLLYLIFSFLLIFFHCFSDYSQLCVAVRPITVRIAVNTITPASSNVTVVVSSLDRWRCRRRSRCTGCSDPPGSSPPVCPLRHTGLGRAGPAWNVSDQRIHCLLERAQLRQVGSVRVLTLELLQQRFRRQLQQFKFLVYNFVKFRCVFLNCPVNSWKKGKESLLMFHPSIRLLATFV